jgi:hypothetical protein
MLLSSLLFTVYFILFLFLNKKTAFFLNTGLGHKTINILFALKVLLGLIYVYTEINIIKGGDLQNFYNDSLEQTSLLLNHPIQFFTSIADSSYTNKLDGLFASQSYWNELRNIFIEKLLGIINLLSFKNLYIDSLFYNYLIFYGNIALYRVFCKIWPNAKTTILLGCFFIPSSAYYLSGINKDSMFFLGLSLVIYAISNILILTTGKLNKRALLLLLAGLAITFIIRNFFFLLLLPAVIAYYLANTIKRRPALIFMAVFGAMAIWFFLSPSLMQIACNRQADFLQLNWAPSLIPVEALQPNFSSFISHLPLAINIAFFRPYIWDSYSIFYFASALEVMVLWVFVLYAVFVMVKQKNYIFTNNLILCCLFYAVFALLFIGFTIPILGAATRYRTAFLPLLITPFLSVIPFNKWRWFKNQ